MDRRAFVLGGLGGLIPLVAFAQTGKAPSVDDKVIRIGQTMPYSGPASAWSTAGRLSVAFVEMINQTGGVNGRKLELLSLDDAFSPPKTVEQTRKLVEQDEVLFIFGTGGAAPNGAIQKYLNGKHVPQLLIMTGANRFNDPAHFPWTMPWTPTYALESSIYAKHVLNTKPNGKVAVLYQNDDFGRDFLNGFRNGLGARADSMIVSALSYNLTDPTIDSQLPTLKASGADVLLNAGSPKFTSLAIRKAAEIGWHPLQMITGVSSGISTVLEPAGLENAKGVLTAVFYKDPNDNRWSNDPGRTQYLNFLKTYFPSANVNDSSHVFAYSANQLLIHILELCGDDLTRPNVMKVATSLRGVKLPMLLPGTEIETDENNFSPIRQMQLSQFDGQSWQLVGDLLRG